MRISWAALLGLGLTVAAMPLFLWKMRSLGWGQSIREEGPEDHKVKAGTPTMGGSVFIPAAMLASLCLAPVTAELLIFWALVIACFVMGLVDDMTAVARKRNLGLKARHKLALQGLIGVAFGAYLLATREPGFDIPFYGFVQGWWLVLGMSVLVVSAATNAVNLTDGLDGLATGTVISALLVYVLIALHQGRSELALSAAALIGSGLGFLWFNCHPARVFMGDTGSLGLGGALAGLCLLTGTPFLLIVVGGVFVAEAVSVIMQVSYFKLTGGKRIFRMSPLHHHFGLGGYHEVQITIRFWLIGMLFALFGIFLYFGGHGFS